MLTDLTSEDRLRLMRFVCAFAWADLEVQSAERDLVGHLVAWLDLTDDEARQVQAWLATPPRPEDVDPLDIPPEHRKLVLDTVLRVVGADGRVDANEAASFALLQQLLA